MAAVNFLIEMGKIRSQVQQAPSSLVEHDHHLVGMDDIEIAAQQFTRKVGIDVTRIEPGNAIADLVALCGQLNDFLLALGQQAVVLTPGKQAAGPGDDDSSQTEQASQGNSLRHTFSRQLRIAMESFHDPTESQLIQRFKKKCSGGREKHDSQEAPSFPR